LIVEKTIRKVIATSIVVTYICQIDLWIVNSFDRG